MGESRDAAAAEAADGLIISGVGADDGGRPEEAAEAVVAPRFLLHSSNMARRSFFIPSLAVLLPSPPLLLSLLLPPKLVRRLAREEASPRGARDPGPSDMRLRRALIVVGGDVCCR